MWLDLFPDEVCERLASHVCHRQFSQSALHLAESSEKQRAAVVAALNFCFPIRMSDCDHADRWAAVFSPDVREYKGLRPLLSTPIWEEQIVAAHAVQVDDARMKAVIVAMLRAPTLRKASSLCQPFFLDAVSQSTSLRDLVIRLYGQPPMQLLFDSLATLQPRKLTIECLVGCASDNFAKDVSRCPFYGQERSDATCKKLAAACPNLEYVEICCLCPSNNSGLRTWRIFPLLPHLKEIDIWCKARALDETLPRLRAMKSVSINVALHGLQLALQIGDSVTALSCGSNSTLLDVGQVAALATLPRLKRLELFISADVDCLLPSALRALPLLESLKLTWVKPGNSKDDRRRWVVCRSGCNTYKTSNAEATPGALLRIVQAVPNLKSLCIRDVDVSLQEEMAVLSFAGSQLEAYLTTVTHHSDRPLDRLEGLLCSAIKHNPELRRFEVFSKGWVRKVSSSVYGDRTMARRSPLREGQEQRLQRALRRLQQSAPNVDTSLLEKLMDERVAFRGGECMHRGPQRVDRSYPPPKKQFRFSRMVHFNPPEP